MERLRLNPLPIAATFSKDPAFWGADFVPQYLDLGQGAHVVGSDGRTYLDWVSALGANLLGYNNREFVLRVQRQVGLGAGFTLPHRLEAQVAEKIALLLGKHVREWTPDGIGIRFGKTGTDATTMAVRLARAVTARYRILSCGYHGWADWSISKTPPAWGIPYGQQVDDFTFNDFGQVARLFDGEPVAAVILEQPMQDPKPGWYDFLRSICDEYHALLIMDEVVTGLRFSLGGACEKFGVRPDLVCCGKPYGNGMAVSFIAGRKDYFEWFSRVDPVFVSSTHFGNAVDLAAADAVLDIWDQSAVDHLYTVGQALKDGLESLGYQIIGHPPRSLLQFDSHDRRARFIAGMRDQGILMNRPNLPNLAHTIDDVRKTLDAAAMVKAEEDRMRVKVLFEGR